jgi:hypothetical protein
MVATVTPQASTESNSSARQEVRLPHRWWATPGYAPVYSGGRQPISRPRGAQIRAHAVAGSPQARETGA